MSPRPKGARGIRSPQQERSRATLERILKAAEDLLERHEFDALRVDELLERASVSTGSFYARFEDKRALLDALRDRYVTDLEATIDGYRRGAGVPETLEARARFEVRGRIRRYRRRRGLMRALVLEHRKESVASARIERLTRRHDRSLVEFFRPCFGEISHPDPERAVLRGAYFVAAVCRDRILFGTSPHARSVAVPLARLEGELTRLLLGYLG